jgi:hypothetical protein
MRHKLLRRPSPALVVAGIALTVALGQTSYAAVSGLIVPKGSIGTLQLKDDAVTSTKVRDFSLRPWDFKRNALPRGPQGLPGAQGPPGVIGDLILREQSSSVPGNKVNGEFVTRPAQVRCQSNERAISGGTRWSTDDDQEDLMTVYSRPFFEKGKPVGWRARGGTDVATDRVFTVMVLCTKD